MDWPVAIKQPRFRSDILGLRGIATLAVVAGHFFGEILPQGYVGVDLFFVISGFVITRKLLFSREPNPLIAAQEFYLSRCRRILPSLYMVIVSSLAVCYLIGMQTKEIVRTAAASAVGLSNYYLLNLSQDYFGISSSLNPFTHTWSLGVEEQFYLLFPAIYFIYKSKKNIYQRRIALLSFIILASLIADACINYKNPNLNFYGLQSRAWEFAAGAIAAELGQRRKFRRNFSSNYYVLAVVLTIWLHASSGFQLRLTIVGITAAWMAIGNESAKSILTTKVFAWIGSRSYSIYLIHWPVLVFFNYLAGDSLLVLVTGVLATFLLSEINFRNVERKFRIAAPHSLRVQTSKFLLASTSLCIGALLLSNTTYLDGKNVTYLFEVSRVKPWPTGDCSGSQNTNSKLSQLEKCLGNRVEGRRNVYLVGDSHADQLEGMVQYAFPHDNFFVQHINNGDFPFEELQRQPNDETFDFLLGRFHAEDILILSFHKGYLNPIRDQHIPLSSSVPVTAETLNLARNLTRYAHTISKLKVKIILVQDTPLMRINQSSESCALQQRLFKRNGCTISKKQDLHTRTRQDHAFESVFKRSSNVLLFDPSRYLFKNSDSFEVFNHDGFYNMFDFMHITQDLSRNLGPTFSREISEFLNRKEK